MFKLYLNFTFIIPTPYGKEKACMGMGRGLYIYIWYLYIILSPHPLYYVLLRDKGVV